MHRLSALLILFAIVAPLTAAPKPAGPAPDRFELRPFQIDIPERGLVPGAELLTASNRFEFIVPDNWVLRNDPARRRLTLATRDDRCHITVSFMTNFTGRLPDLEALRAFAVRRAAGARLIGDRHAYSGMGRGHAFDFQRAVAGGIVQNIRLFYVPMPDESAEFRIVTLASDGRRYRYVIGDFLSSFLREPLPPATPNSKAGLNKTPRRP